MASRIEDYAVIGNCETMALVSRDGCIDWLCLPRFDSASCFAALLGDDGNGSWRISAAEKKAKISRHYREGTLILETLFETETGSAVLIDCMSRGEGKSNLLRRVRGISGSVEMVADLAVRFDYGVSVPWVSRTDDGRTQFIVGPDRLLLQSSVEVENKDMRTAACFTVQAGEEIDFCLGWSKSFHAMPPLLDVGQVIDIEDQGWRAWSGKFEGLGEYSGIVLRSLITLKGLTHFETGGIVAAATTSLPEQIGGSRNWDYRYCWLRDATLTLFALMESNFVEEANAWQQWLIRAIAGAPEQLQIMYGIAGERRLDEWNVPWLPGYENSSPVHVGNAAAGQVQLDVYGEVLAAMYYGRTRGLQGDETLWSLECGLLRHLQEIWQQPDDGIWEVRSGRQQFTHSKVMAWVAVDRAIRSAEEFGLEAPLDAWREWRQQIHDEVCEKAFDAERNSFVQYYGSKNLDAGLLMIAIVGFLPPEDPRVRGTVEAIEKDLLRDGFVIRYDTGEAQDGLPPGEGAFLACSFWLVGNYVLLGRLDDARALFNRLAGLANDVGLLAEEYDPKRKRQVGNFPQAFSHIALINAAYTLAGAAAAKTGGGEAPAQGAYANAQS
jgi:GH15 family glucan-1,4-alpha-glucosidase